MSKCPKTLQQIEIDTFPCGKRRLISNSLDIPLSNGPRTDKSNTLPRQMELDSTVNKVYSISSTSKSPLNARNKRKYATQESVVLNRKKTWKDKSICLGKLIQNIGLSRTLDLDSTSTDQVLKPFWNKSSEEKFPKLWYPTLTDSVDLPETSSKASSNLLTPNSWFSIKSSDYSFKKKNSPKMCYPSSMSLWPNVMDCAQRNTNESVKKRKTSTKTEKKTLIKTRRIRIYPTREQKQTLNKWFGAARWTYNQCVAGIKKKQCWYNRKSLRNKYVNNKNFIHRRTWVTEVPYDIRDEAAYELTKAIKTAKTQGKPFDLKFRSKKRQQSETIMVLKKHWGRKNGAYSTIFGKDCLQSSEPLPEKLDGDSKLTRTRFGLYYMCLSVEQTLNLDNQEVKKDDSISNIISIDPGVRTFATCYDMDGKTFEWGINDCPKLVKLGLWLDRLQGYCARKEIRHKKRYRIRRAMFRIRQKIRNRVDDLHRKLAKWLCKTYKVIVLPKFSSGSMVQKKKRVIGSKTVRSMLTWSHFRFRQHLQHKINEYPNTYLLLVNEAFTSKTCGGCGSIDEKLGSKKVFQCSKCDFHCDRDVNGARNILLKFFADFG